MLTVKYIESNGNEIVFPVHAVRYSAQNQRDHTCHAGGDVWFDTPSGADERLAGVSTGTVYVMNEAGKTVAKYELGQGCREIDPMDYVTGGSSHTISALGGKFFAGEEPEHYKAQDVASKSHQKKK
jgi:hypothetical protein